MNCRTVAAIATLCTSLPLAGQTRSEPQILLSIFGGLGGGTDLWTVARQPLLILASPGSLLPSVYDTLRVSRQLRPGVIAGINATYFPTSHVGLLGEISFMGFGREDRCTMIAEDIGSDPSRQNRQVCDDIEGRAGAASTVAFSVGAIARTAPGPVVPYVRIQGGFTSRQSSLTELSGRFLNTGTGGPVTRGIYVDPGGGRIDPTAAIGLGLMAQISAGYQFRLEVRDHLVRVREVTGPATLNNPGVPPVGSRSVHSLALLVHLDIVLERKRGRRY